MMSPSFENHFGKAGNSGLQPLANLSRRPGVPQFDSLMIIKIQSRKAFFHRPQRKERLGRIR
jgi:hypothetical protein